MTCWWLGNWRTSRTKRPCLLRPVHVFWLSLTLFFFHPPLSFLSVSLSLSSLILPLSPSISLFLSSSLPLFPLSLSFFSQSPLSLSFSLYFSLLYLSFSLYSFLPLSSLSLSSLSLSFFSHSPSISLPLPLSLSLCFMAFPDAWRCVRSVRFSVMAPKEVVCVAPVG